MGSETIAGPWRRPRRRAGVATFLSMLWPGLGQWYAGRPLAAVLQAIPVAIVLLVVAIFVQGDIQRLAIQLFDPGTALAMLALVVLLGVWRIVSMVHAHVAAGGRSALRGGSLAALAVLVAIAIGGHAIAASVALDFYEAGSRIFVADPLTPGPAATPDPAVTPAPGVTPGPATPSPAPQSNRINVLLTGVDSSSIRSHSLTDTLIVVSIDPDTGAVAMVSFPRDIARFPLWDGRRFNGKINELMTYAAARPKQFPDGGIGTVTRELGFLLGIDIDYYAAINLDGFERLIDEVGGVTIVNDRAINDPAYGGWHDGRVGFHLPAGTHHLDGATALAYARSRKGAGDNDFTRARRQQQLLVALRKRLTEPAMLPRLSGVLDAASRTVSTNFPPGRLSEMLDVSERINDDAIRRYVLGPPYAKHPPTSSTGGIYTLALDMDRLAKLSIDLFGDDSRYAQLGSG